MWTGQQARQTRPGGRARGLNDAIEIAKERAKIPADEDVEVVLYPARRSIYEALTEQFAGAGFNAWSLLGGDAERRPSPH